MNFSGIGSVKISLAGIRQASVLDPFRHSILLDDDPCNCVCIPVSDIVGFETRAFPLVPRE
jgi:hypothetical protein